MELPAVRISAATMAITPLIVSDIAVAQAAAPPRQDYGYFHGHGMIWGDHMGGVGGGVGLLLGPLFMIIVVVAIAAAIVVLMRAFGVAGPSIQSVSGQSGNRALDILKERFAKGEIDAEEFNERKRQLSD